MHIARYTCGRRMLAAALAATVLSSPALAGLVSAPAPPRPEAATGLFVAQAATPAAAPAALPAPEAPAFTRQELETLLAPYALFPDALLAQLLPASAYPIEIVQASRWLAKNKAAIAKGDFSGVDDQPWEPSVKALARFPDLIEKLNADLDATSDLGDAFVNQPDDVAAVIQDLRRRAQKAGTLKSTPQQRVTVQKQASTEYVVIEPADPGVIYVPAYDPVTVYDPGAAVVSGLIGFGVGVAVGAAIDNAWDWGRGWVYPPRWPGYPGYRPGYPGYRPVGDVNIGSGNVIVGNGNRPWRPDPDRYRPGQGTKPGLARPADRPRPGGGNTVNIGNTVNVGGGNKVGNKVDVGNKLDINKVGGGGNKVGSGGNAIDIGNKGDIANKVGGGGNKVGGGGNKADIGNKIGNAKPGKGQPIAKPLPAQRPAGGGPALRDTAFGDAKLGGAANFAAQRGAASRASVDRGGGGPAFQRGGGGGAPGFQRGGGGGGGRPAMHGGGRGGGGGGAALRRH